MAASVPSSNGALEFNELARQLFALQYAHNKSYRCYCRSQKVSPGMISDWTQIPAIPAVAFKEMELTSLPVSDRTRVFHSSGTTKQQPSRHVHNAESLRIYEASLMSWFNAHVVPDLNAELQSAATADPSSLCSFRRLPILFLTPSQVMAPHSSLVHMFETIHREFGASGSLFIGKLDAEGAWQIDCEMALRFLDHAVRTDAPIMLLGTAFTFVHLLDALEERKLAFALPQGSRVMETGGYKGRSRSMPKGELHQSIADQLGIPKTHIIAEYGMSELSSQAYDLKVPCSVFGVPCADRAFHFPPWARVQIISPETGQEVNEGQTGLIRVFDLANLSSVLAVQTEDLGVRRGSGFELIGRAALAEPRGCSLMSAQDVCAELKK